MNEEIKPCPFCGDTDPYWDEKPVDNEMIVFLVCRECGCEGPVSALHVTAAKLWNIRVEV